MFRNIARTIGVGGQPTEPVTKPNAIGGDKNIIKRRALGDITNATNGQEDIKNKDNNTKKAFSIFTVPAPVVVAPVIQQQTRQAAHILDEDERSYMQRPSDDIDARDTGNPLLCTTYVNEMYDNFNELEREYAVKDYISSQENVNERMRTILVDWLVSILSFLRTYLYV